MGDSQLIKGRWMGYKNYSHYYTFDELEEFFIEVNAFLNAEYNDGVKLVVGRRLVHYYNIPASFDIETYSWDNGGVKYASMYVWQFGLNGSVIIGRTWSEFRTLLKRVEEELELNYNSRLIVYVHNLGYEFQFMRKQIEWSHRESGEANVFAIKERRPIYALAECGIEFRCSLLLSNYALAYVGSELLKRYPVQKMVGDLDYSIPRHSLTPLSDKEIDYCINDVRVVMSYIQEKIENEELDISKLPLTNTGYVRNYCRNYCMTDGAETEEEARHRKFEYRAIMKNLVITSEQEYSQLKSAFAGGFTHASALHSGKVIKNVGSADLTSSYPYTMVAEYFPMSKCCYIGECEVSRLSQLAKNYCCLFTVKFYNIWSEFDYDSYISTSHCDILSDDYVANNGRLASASECQITVTELDWDIICKIYSWEDCEIHGLRIYDRGYLPRPLIMSILDLYENKTSLKGVSEKEVEYMVSKNMINAAYGMAVTAIVRDEHVYEEDAGWLKEEADVVSQLTNYDKDFNRFLFYAWGVWVTAHARHNLWDAIFEFGEDYVYSDTDSIKGINFDNHKDFFICYNLEVKSKLYKMCSYYSIPFSKVQPKTIKGVKKVIGVWDIEEPYLLFKTLGAKRYMYEHQSHELGMTVSGVNKKYALPWLLNQFSGQKFLSEEWYKFFKLCYSPDPRLKRESKKALSILKEMRAKGEIGYEGVFHVFKQYLMIPPGATGKQTLTYLDNPFKTKLVDYYGIEWECSELSAVHMEPAGYFFTITKQYIDFINGVQDASI